MKQSLSRKANSRSVCLKINRPLWIPKVYNHVQKSPSLHYLIQTTPSFFQIYFNIILSSAPRSHKWVFPLAFQTEIYPCLILYEFEVWSLLQE